MNFDDIKSAPRSLPVGDRFYGAAGRTAMPVPVRRKIMLLELFLIFFFFSDGVRALIRP